METRNCQNCKKDFTIDPEDFLFYTKMQVPAPTFCPECRMIRRFNYRNEARLFRRPDAHTGKEIFSGFAPEASVLTYENTFWFGSEWDPLSTGVMYDFNRPFFEQFRELLAVSPLPARSVYNLVNSDYCNEASEMKNAYLCFNTDFIENAAYSRKVSHVKDSLDVYETSESELCYEGALIAKSYQTMFSFDCDSCVDVWFSKGLRGCTNCFGCVNLRNKSYYFFNEPCTKEEYTIKLQSFVSESYASVQTMRTKVKTFWAQFPVKYNHTLRTIDSTGERIFDSKEVYDSYSVYGGENLRYCQDIQPKGSNSYDYSVWGSGSENMYECMTCGLGCYNLRFCFNCWQESRDLEYCVYCLNSSDCFGCVGLYKKQYCIFNTQYTKEEYFILREQIIKQMQDMPYIDARGRSYTYGEFFPHEISPIAYNESLAQDFFSLTASEAHQLGYVWREHIAREFDTTLTAADLPDLISDVGDDILKEIIKCATCKRAYRIVLMELQFYRKMKLPIPHDCYECRFKERFKLINPPKLWLRTCMHEGCQNTFESSYEPARPEIVYCEDCYQDAVQ